MSGVRSWSRISASSPRRMVSTSKAFGFEIVAEEHAEGFLVFNDCNSRGHSTLPLLLVAAGFDGIIPLPRRRCWQYRPSDVRLPAAAPVAM